MALRKDVVTVPLVKGVDSSTDPKLLQDGLLILENARVTRRGEVRKRLAHTTIASSDNACPFMTSWKDEPVLIGAEALKVFNGSPASPHVGTFNTRGAPALFEAPVQRIGDGSSADGCEIAESASVRVLVRRHQDGASATMWVTIRSYDILTGDVLATAGTTAAASHGGIRVVWTGARLLVVYAAATGVLYRREVNATTGSIGSATALNSGTPWTVAGSFFHMCALGDANDSVCLAMEDTVGNDLRVVCIKGDNTEYSNTMALTNGVIMGCYPTGASKAAVITAEDSGATRTIEVSGWSATATNDNAVATVWTGGGASESEYVAVGAPANSSTDGVVYFTYYDSSAVGHQYQLWKNTVTVPSGAGACSTGTAAKLKVGLMPVATPLWESGEATHYLITVCIEAMALSGKTRPVSYLVIDGDGKYYARLHPGRAFTYLSINSRVHSLGSAQWRVALLSFTYGAGPKAGIALYTIRGPETTLSMRCVETENSLIIPGALPQVYDGEEVVEQGFAWYPPTLSVAAVGGSLSGTFGYKAVYAHVDSKGLVWRSDASDNASITLSSQSANVTVPTLTCTNRGQNSSSFVQIELYRTVDNGNRWYKCATKDNNATATNITFNDTMTDATLVSQPALYTHGEVENMAPYPFSISCIHQERLFYVNEEFSSTRVQYSKTFMPDTGICYNDDFLITVPPDGGEIKALASFQGQLFIFKEERVYYTYGDGFTPGGSGSNYAMPQLLSAVVGCVNQKTVVRIPQGIAFLSRDGIWLVGKSGLVEIGAPVQYWTDTYDYNAYCAGSEVIGDRHKAVWLSSESGAPALVFDYEHEVWGTHLNHRATDCVVSNGGHLYHRAYTASANEVVNVEHPGFWMDGVVGGGNGTTHVPLRFRTPWLAFAGPMESFRLYKVQILGQYISASDIRVKVAYDYDPVWVDDQRFNLYARGNAFDYDEHYKAGLASGYINYAMILEMGTSQQVARAVMLEITDENYGAGASKPLEAFTVNALTFEVGRKGRANLKDIGSARSF